MSPPSATAQLHANDPDADDFVYTRVRDRRSSQSPRHDPLVVRWRGQEPRDHQLPHLQARARTASSAQRSSARSGTTSACCGKYKRIEAQGRRLRQVRRRGDQSQRVRRERMGHIELAAPGRPHLVPARRCPAASACMLDMTLARPRAGPLLRGLHCHRPGQDRPLEPRQLLDRGRVPPGRRASTATTRSTRAHGRRGRPRAPQAASTCADVAESSAHEIARRPRSKQIKKKLAKRLKVVEAFTSPATAPSG
jgi:hypothetical protein